MHLRHVSTGDMLREAIRRDQPAGRAASEYMLRGQLVPDEVVNEIINELFASDNRPENFVMDGYPRTLAQAASFDQVLRQHGLGIDAIVRLVVPDDEIVARVSGRWTCPNPTCNATYHLRYRPPKVAGVCDLCKTPLTQRPDDREEVVRQRLGVYHQPTTDLLAYYRQKGLLREVPATGDVEAVYNRIVKVL
jgi:adenylate kinase